MRYVFQVTAGAFPYIDKCSAHGSHETFWFCRFCLRHQGWNRAVLQKTETLKVDTNR